jgi:hypothetical protein
MSAKGKRFGGYVLDVILVIVALFIGWLIEASSSGTADRLRGGS